MAAKIPSKESKSSHGSPANSALNTTWSRESGSVSLKCRSGIWLITRINKTSNSGFGSTAALCARSEEHTSELQSPCNLVCRLLLEKKKKNREHVINV